MRENFVSCDYAIADLDAHPDKKIFWRSGFAWKGAGEFEIPRDPEKYPQKNPFYVFNNRLLPVYNSWKDKLRENFKWACVVNLDKNTDEEMHLNGLSENDMY